MKLSKKVKGQQIGIHQILNYFEKTLNNPNNYVRIARQYLMYVLSNGYTVDIVSAGFFCAGKSPSYMSACKKLILFMQENNILQIYDDTPPDLKGNAMVLQFLAHTQLASTSKITYSQALCYYESYLQEHNLTMNRPSVLRFLEELKNKKTSPYTRNTYLAVIRQFANFCILHREELQLNPEFITQLRDIQTIRNAKIGGTLTSYNKESLTEEERTLLLQSITNPKEKTILALMALQGLRSVEVIRLDWEDIIATKQKKMIAVWGKGREEKEMIPLLADTEKIINEYKKTVLKPKGSMFGFSNTSSIRKITNKWLDSTGLKTNKLSAHSLRHSAAQIMIKKGVPKAMVKRFLRHKSEQTTSIYTAKQEDNDFLKYDFE